MFADGWGVRRAQGALFACFSIQDSSGDILLVTVTCYKLGESWLVDLKREKIKRKSPDVMEIGSAAPVEGFLLAFVG